MGPISARGRKKGKFLRGLAERRENKLLPFRWRGGLDDQQKKSEKRKIVERDPMASTCTKGMQGRTRGGKLLYREWERGRKDSFRAN